MPTLSLIGAFRNTAGTLCIEDTTETLSSSINVARGTWACYVEYIYLQTQDPSLHRQIRTDTQIRTVRLKHISAPLTCGITRRPSRPGHTRERPQTPPPLENPNTPFPLRYNPRPIPGRNISDLLINDLLHCTEHDLGEEIRRFLPTAGPTHDPRNNHLRWLQACQLLLTLPIEPWFPLPYGIAMRIPHMTNHHWTIFTDHHTNQRSTDIWLLLTPSLPSANHQDHIPNTTHRPPTNTPEEEDNDYWE